MEIITFCITLAGEMNFHFPGKKLMEKKNCPPPCVKMLDRNVAEPWSIPSK